MKHRFSPRRAMFFGIALLLLVVMIGGVFRLISQNDANPENAPSSEMQETPVSGDAAFKPGSSDRSARDEWRRTVESAAAGLMAKDDAPVRIGFVQASPDQRQWRVSLQRTPATGEVLDTAKITIRVETLASPDDAKTNNRDDLAIEWETQGRSFEEAAAPRLKVTAEKPLSHVRFSVFYDGTEIERRTFSAEPTD